jgi:long-chain fatty acid transport protein
MAMVGAGLGALACGRAEAAGFALHEQSATGQGSAFAGVAAGGDPSSMFFNPATMGLVEGYQIQSVINIIMPTAKLRNSSASTIGGVPIQGRDQISDIEDNAVVPALYAIAPLGPDWRLGLAVNVPFGLESDYQRNWVGRYQALNSKLKTININPMVSWRAMPWLTLGAGVQAQYADAQLTQAIDIGTIGAGAGIPTAAPGQQDGFARTTGNDWSYGYNLGVVVEPLQGTRFGLGYRSEIDHRLKGDTDFTLDQQGIGSIIKGATGAFQDSGITADLDTPASVSFGVRQDLGDRFALLGELDWTRWSSFDQLEVAFDNPAQPSSVTEEKWNDTWFASVGGLWKATDTLTLRAGIAYDQSPVTDKYRTPRVPDEDRYWLSMGAGWQPLDWLSLDVAYSHIFVDDPKVDLKATDEGSQLRGNLSATYDASIDLIAISAKIRF